MEASRAALSLLLLGILLLPTADAVVPEQPSHVAIDVIKTRTYIVGSDTWTDWYFNLSFHVSPNDPNQVNGSFKYGVIVNGYDYGVLHWPGILDNHTIPGRPGWLRIKNSTEALISGDAFFSDLQGDLYNDTVPKNLSVYALDGTDYTFSCQVTFERRPTSHGECGQHWITPPLGSAVYTLYSATTTQNLTIANRYVLSANDTGNATLPGLDYRVFYGVANFSAYRVNQTLANTTPFDETTTDANVVVYNLLPGGTYDVLMGVKAVDNPTLRQSNESCQVQTIAGTYGLVASCGYVSVSLDREIVSDIEYPFVDADTTASLIGASPSLIGGILAAITIIVFGGIGMAYASWPGGLFGGLIGVGFAATTGVMPLWLLILLFLIGVTILVFTFKGGSQE